MRLGSCLVSEHAIVFRVTAADSGWNSEALKSAFLNSLSDQLQDQIATRDEPDSLDDLINPAIRLDNRLPTLHSLCVHAWFSAIRVL